LSSGQLKATAEFVINYGVVTVNSLETEDSTNYSDEEQAEQMEMNPDATDKSSNENHLLECCPPNVEYQWARKDLKGKEFSQKPNAHQFNESQTPAIIFNGFFFYDVKLQ